ncbi:potassium channel protein [Pseudoalteromonas piscicida]|uniref:Potassium channel protein n=1 Tax=Pseudoalteromonas piscicida TaxID=43662 RepID=A0AAQ2EWW5_PSEO7|nr:MULTISPECIES: potassium channel family protein [Pseudoalteromonas]KJY85306.1 potassium channel protein [Pseudoalteromonas piscicida]MDP4490626.1 potassium channel family protein [Pseudoalteromonas piscicida]ODB33383.1 potassium channel protein [Pseudoalteromonas sp. BMB]QZO13131.1 two pore domain potassium channel family protein [Pseudoalteromonas piscicida]TMN42107.1 potassium channel protein [Pseudoalteromonas piscicida]
MPIIFKRLVVLMRAHVDKASWQLLFMATLIHMSVTWGLLWLSNESALLPLSTFFYYYVVTTSTVGYGDFSATTDFGRLVVAIIQIPFGLALFGVLLGKAGQFVTYWVRRGMTGEKDFAHLQNHIVIFGWHDVRTKKMVDYILGDNKREDRKIVLAVTEAMEHPLLSYPEVAFARLTSFTDDEQLSRINIERADKIIIDGDDDNQTFTTALKLSRVVKPEAHISAHFLDDSKALLLREHCKNVECSASMSAEILVRAMQDPGSSRVQEELLSTLHGDTQFSLALPAEVSCLTFGDIFGYFKQHHDATLLGVAHDINALNMDLNPPLDYNITGGDILHYIAPQRVLASEVDWSSLCSKNSS